MSINKFQEKIFRTGCGSVVLYISAAVFFGGMFYLGCGLGGNVNGQNSADNRIVAVDISGTPVYYDDINKMVEGQKASEIQQISQSGGTPSPDSISPVQEAKIYGDVLTQSIKGTATYLLAKKSGVVFSDDLITREEEKTFESQVMMLKMQLVQQKKLSATATDKEFDEALKKQSGSSVTEAKKMFHQRLVEALKDQKTRPQLEIQLASQLLLAKITQDLRPTDKELMAGYDDYVMKRILFVAHPGSTVESQIEKAKADIKAGVPFDTVIDRYSGEAPPSKGGKPSQNSINLLASQIELMPEFKPIASLKINDVSDVIDTAQGKAIYKLLIKTNAAPKDFDKKKAEIAKSFAETKAQPKLDKEIKDYMASSAVSWKIPALKAIFDWNEAQKDTTTSPAELSKKMGAIVDEAKKAATSGKGDARPAMLTWYVAFDSIWNAPGADKEKLRGDRIVVLKALTSIQPYFALKLELVDLLIASKAGDEAVEVLKSAASSNYLYDPEGQKDFQDVQAKMIALKDAGYLKPAAEAEIQKIQDSWKTENAKAEADKALAKQQEEQAKKEAAANDAKQKAETLKQKADADKNKKPGDGSVTAGGITAKVAPGQPVPPAKTPAGTTPPAPIKK